jgi:hypothetical protein
MSDLRKILHTQYIQDTNPRYPSGSKGWETFLIDRIALLEAVAKEVILEYKEERRSGNCGWAGEEVAALAALLQDKP